MINPEQILADDQSSKKEKELKELGLEREYNDLLEGAQALKQGVHAWEADYAEDRSAVIIAGPTAGGKTKLQERLEFSEDNTVFLSLDRYYLGAQIQEERDGEVNFSIPSALDEKRIKADLKKIMQAKAGDKVKVPVYSMTESRRTGEEEIVVKRRLVVDGVYAIKQSGIETPFKVYVDASEDILLERKLPRDTGERKVPEEVVRKRFEEKVVPAIREYVNPQKELANIVIHNVESIEE